MIYVEAYLTTRMERDHEGYVRQTCLLDANGKTVGWWFKGDWVPMWQPPVVYRELIHVPIGEDPLVSARKLGAK